MGKKKKQETVTAYLLVESFGLIPQAIPFTSGEERDAYIRDLILRDDTGDLDSWLHATARDNYNEDEIEHIESGTDEEKLTWLVGHGFLSDGNKWELRTDELEIPVG